MGFLLQAKVSATWLVLGTSFMVAFTNAAINKITRLMGVFERHLSVDKQEVHIHKQPAICFFDLRLLYLLLL